ncbi:MAG: hypothetical protein WCY88_02295 [Spongiibacteraceae bacterium]
MIQFFLSKILAEDMAMHVSGPQPDHAVNTKEVVESPVGADKPAVTLLPVMTWYAHRVIIARRKCIIIMEATSRYAMVFCGMKKADFEHFPDLFQDRLWREVFAVCEGIPESDISQLSATVLNICEQQRYQIGHDRSVTAHIKQVAEHLELMVRYQGETLPVDRMAAFEFGVSVNELLRKRRGDKDYFRPVEAFQDLCGELISGDFIAVTVKDIDINNKLREKPNHLKSAAKNYSHSRKDGNVIHVDFKNKH